jgi:hypothetical protein
VGADTTVLGMLQALKNGGSDMGVTDRLISISSYAIDPCMQKASACGSNKLKDSINAAAPGWSSVSMPCEEWYCALVFLAHHLIMRD